MFTSVLSTVTKALFQQFEVKIPPPTFFDSHLFEECYRDLTRDADAGTNFDLCLTQDEEEDAVLVDEIMTEDRGTCFIHGYLIQQPRVNRMHLASTTAKGIFKKVSTGARLAYSSANSGKKVLQKKAMHLVSTPVVEEESIMDGYHDAFGCPIIEKPNASNSGAGPSNRNSRRSKLVDPQDKCMDVPKRNLPAIETEDDAWELV